MKPHVQMRNCLALAFSILSFIAHAQYPELDWAQGFGSTQADISSAITSDPAGNIYATGQFFGTVDFDNGPGTVNLTSVGNSDVFVAKFNPAGTLIWAKRLGGTQQDFSAAIAIDGAGNVFVTGVFSATADLDPGTGVANFTSAGEWDIFACKLDANGDYQWAYAVGGISFDRGISIAVNAANDVVVTGNFRQTVDFDPGPGATTFTNVGLDDSFIVKLNGATGGLLWAKQIECQARGIAIDASDNTLTIGAFAGTVDFDPGAGVFQLTGIANEAFVLKLDDSGNFVWAVGVGGNSDDVGQAVKTVAAGNVYTAGYFVRGDGTPHDFDPGPGVFQLTPMPDTNPSNSDIYISKLTASGSFVWAKHIGGIGTEQPLALAVDATGNVYTTGHFQGTVDFDPGSSTYSFTADGFANAYVSKLNVSGDFVWADRTVGNHSGFGRGIAIDNANQVIVSGNFSNTADFSAGSCDFNLTSSGSSDIFIQKLSQTGPPPPYIASFTPTIGLAGTTVTLTGTNFDPTPGNNTVKFNGTTAVVTVSTATSITTSVPAGATTGFITVSVGCATGISQIPYTVDSCVPADEKNALVQLYNAAYGTNWTNNANWLTTDVSTWYGVTVAGCSVTEVRLGDNGLAGYLPLELVDLNELEVFDVNENNLAGYIPDGFSSMPNLNTLNLSNNNFSVLPNLTTGSLNTAVLDLDVSSNALDFGDLEPNIAFANFTYAPQAVIPPHQLVGFTVGSTLTINFSTPGTANAYQWLKEGASIGGATNTNLSIPSATLAQAGSYTVEITNSLVPSLTLQSAVHQAVASPCSPGPRTSGQLDVSFNHAIDNQTYVGGVAVQSTGKVIVALPTTSIGGTPVVGTVRFNTDGTLDGSFNIIPEYTVPLIQTDDKILGYANDQVIRYDADGTDDVAFNSNAPQSYSSTLYAMALQPDGKIVYSVEAYMGSRELLRLNTDGNVDPSFTIQPILANVIKVQADGKILIASNGFVSRLNSDGTGDLSFSVGLENVTTINDLAIQPDGKVLIAGNFTGVDGVPHFGIARVNSDGTVDNTFSAIGLAELNILDGAYKIGLMSNGQIILAGEFTSVNGAPRKHLVRLNADGSIDCGFDPGTSTDEYISGMALQADDQILVTGYFTVYDGTQRFGLARVDNGGATIAIIVQPTDFTACDGQIATFTSSAAGTTNITYQWQFSPDGVMPFADITDGGGYSNVTTPTLSVNTTGNFGSGRYRCKINGDLALTAFTNDEGLFINPLPAAPTTTGASRCDTGSLTLNASGGGAGQYRWYTASTGGTAIAGQTNSSFATPTISVTTTYYVSIDNGSCESARATVVAAIGTFSLAPTATGGSNCGSGIVTLSASGGSAGQYRWYTEATGGTAMAGQTDSTFATPSLSVTTSFYVSIDNGTCESSRTAVVATIHALPAAPTTTGASNCGTGSVTLNAAGGSIGAYRWYTVGTGGTALVGQTNATFTTPALTGSTNYFVAIDNGLCESSRTLAVATIDPVPPAPTTTGASGCAPPALALTASGGADGQYRWYAATTGGTAIPAQANASFLIANPPATITYYVAINNGTCESARTAVTAVVNNPPAKPVITSSEPISGGITAICLSPVVLTAPAGFTAYNWSTGATTATILIGAATANVSLRVTDVNGCQSAASDPLQVTVDAACNNSPPVIAPASVSTSIGSTATVPLSALVSDPDNNLDLATLRVISVKSGAPAAIVNQTLEVNYFRIGFSGTDEITIEVCDLDNVCAQATLFIDVVGDVVVYNGISANGDAQNAALVFQYIDVIAETRQNKVSIFNRWGDLVWEGENYDNLTTVFVGQSKSGNDLPSGIYFYQVEFASGTRAALTGYLSLKR